MIEAEPLVAQRLYLALRGALSYTVEKSENETASIVLDPPSPSYEEAIVSLLSVFEEHHISIALFIFGAYEDVEISETLAQALGYYPECGLRHLLSFELRKLLFHLGIDEDGDYQKNEAEEHGGGEDEAQDSFGCVPQREEGDELVVFREFREGVDQCRYEGERYGEEDNFRQKIAKELHQFGGIERYFRR